MTRRILVVDDEPSIRKVLSAHLRRMGHEVDTAEDGEIAIARLSEEPYHLVVSDLKMPRTDGMSLLRWVERHQPGLPLVLVTAHGTVETAVEALKHGAHDYLTKPFDLGELERTIAKALATEAKNAQQMHAEPGSASKAIIGSTPQMREVFRLVDKVAASPTTVLITGESGTGKELVARALHEKSERRDAPFIQVNCGAIPETLFEAELFGYEKGAFTGAVGSKPGRFELAHGGTLFLDEIGELPRDLQVKLLRALQERRIDRVGGVKPIEVDVRVVAATNVDLQKAVEDGRFRNDLYYRLSVFPIHLPSLRERVDDLPILVEHFLRQFSTRLGKSVTRVSPDALAALLEHPWPGNIRELENLVERAVLLTESDTVTLADLPALRRGSGPALDGEELDALDLKEYVRVHLARIERARIQRVLQVEDGNVTRAARRLGISRKSLQTKMKEYGLRDGG
ncbi:MAG: sigma-54-dependent Fis family transcriptional regulator [Alphaproteobacteria bacterium]|nr:sigma-54-dependent Fis family transcriptional regulator [Alphaproteobacteria bacterium]MCB9697246.1 sigma-54-dependent Fis family transcriptional regulator [Alphaproteobacteria bacterium]